MELNYVIDLVIRIALIAASLQGPYSVRYTGRFFFSFLFYLTILIIYTCKFRGKKIILIAIGLC